MKEQQKLFIAHSPKHMFTIVLFCKIATCTYYSLRSETYFGVLGGDTIKQDYEGLL